MSVPSSDLTASDLAASESTGFDVSSYSQPHQDLNTDDFGDLHPELVDCIRQHQETTDRIQHMLSSLTREQFNWRPVPGRWSIAQNIHHLSLECREQIPIVERLIEKGRTENIVGSGNFRHPWFGQYYCWFLEPPYRAKITTAPRFEAPSDMDFSECVPEFMAHKERLIELTRNANGLHLSQLRAKVTYVQEGIAKYAMWTLSLGQWLRFFAIHERRHLWQIEQFVLGDANFPTG